MENIKMTLVGLNCTNCAGVIEQRAKENKRTEEAVLNFNNKVLTVKPNDGVDVNSYVAELKEMIDSTEPGLTILVDGVEFSDYISGNMTISNVNSDDVEAEENRREKRILIIAAVIYALAVISKRAIQNEYISIALYMLAYVVAGKQVFTAAFRNLLKKQPFDENLLMTIASAGAIAIGEYPEAVGVMIFYRLGEYLQGIAVGKSRRSIKSLIAIRPDYANKVIGSEIVRVDPNEVDIDDIIVVSAGEKVPVDAIVYEGETFFDTSVITGESVARRAKAGDAVSSGFINKEGTVKLKATKKFGESTVSKILDLVENAGANKSKTENFITKFARYYTPIVVLAAALIIVFPPIILSQPFDKWLYRGLVFLVVSCPCALLLSIPLAFFSGIGVASRYGVLVKGGNFLEALNEVDTVVMDKTGTLTKGVFDVTKANPVGISEEELVEYAAAAEFYSNHPIAKSIIKRSSKAISMDDIKDYKELAAMGVRAEYNGREILAGNSRLMDNYSIEYNKVDSPYTTVYVAVDGMFAGSLEISDRVKEDAKPGLDMLKKIGINNLVMLTGDNKRVADAISEKLGITKTYSQLTPIDKVNLLEQICNKNNNGKVMFVGDGINDAPVLARADIGVAMGAIGSDAAIEASDMVLMTDDIRHISKSIEIARKTNRIVKENIAFALGVKILIMILGAFGLADMWEAIFGDVGVALLAVLNSMRIGAHMKKYTREHEGQVELELDTHHIHVHEGHEHNHGGHIHSHGEHSHSHDEHGCCSGHNHSHEVKDICCSEDEHSHAIEDTCCSEHEHNHKENDTCCCIDAHIHKEHNHKDKAHKHEEHKRRPNIHKHSHASYSCDCHGNGDDRTPGGKSGCCA